MRRGLGRALRTLGTAAHLLLILLCGIAVAIVVLAWRPELALTPPVLAKAVKRFGRSYRPTWTTFELRLQSEGFLHKRFTLAARDFCVDDSSGSAKACFESVDADVTLRLSRRGIRVARVARLDVRGRYVDLNLTARNAPAAAPRRYRTLNSYIPRPLHGARIDELDLRLPDTEVRTASAAVSGDFALAYSSSLAVSAQVYYDTPAKSENVEINFKAESDWFTTGRLRRLRAVGTLEGDVDDHVRFQAAVSQTARRRTVLQARLKLQNAGRTVTARVDGDETVSRYAGRLAAALEDPRGKLRRLELSSCELDAPKSNEGSVDRFHADCRLGVEPPPVFGAAHTPAAKKIQGTARLDVRLRPRPKQPDRFEAALHAAMAPIKSWYQVNATLDAQVAGQLGDIPRSLKIKHDLRMSLTVARFQDLVKYLDGTAYAVPAPFHVLTGPITASLTSRGDPRQTDQEAVYEAKADLTSGRQVVKARLDGRLVAEKLLLPGRRLEDRTQLVLQDVRLELPYLKLGKPPPLKTDPRIRTEEEPAPVQGGAAGVEKSTAARPSAFHMPSIDYEATLKTENPVTLYTNLNPQPIPVALDLAARPGGMSGTIEVRPFVANLFRRQGQVDHVILSARPGSSTLGLDGLIKFRESSTDVRLMLLGTTERPRVVFESDPPLEPQQIIALLIFGKQPDDLDPDQNTTVSNSQSAMETGAFGLASLYLFASTPVQYVGYDPGTQTYSMRFNLPGGTSLEVGSASDQSKHLTLRKRLARHWVIETELQRDQEQQRNAVNAFLEWFQRY